MRCFGVWNQNTIPLVIKSSVTWKYWSNSHLLRMQGGITAIPHNKIIANNFRDIVKSCLLIPGKFCIEAAIVKARKCCDNSSHNGCSFPYIDFFLQLYATPSWTRVR